MRKRAIHKAYPIRHYVKVLLLILFSVLLLDCFISFVAIKIVKDQTTNYLQDTATMYINRINLDFSNINQYMGWTLANDANVKTMNQYLSSDAPFIKANTELYKRFSELQKNYEKQYNFFIYLKDQKYFLNSSPTNLVYPDFLELKKQIMSYVEDKDSLEQFYSDWSPIRLNNKSFIINIVPFHDSYLICLISADNLISPLQQMDLAGNGVVSLIDHKGEVIDNNSMSNTQSEMEKKEEKTSLLEMVQTKITVSESFANASFGVKMIIKLGAFEKIMIAQLLIMLLAVIVACSLCGIMVYFNILILRPLKNFSYSLTQLNEDSKPLDLKMNKIVELEYANKLFQNLIEQIRIFKIDMYENEIEKQKIQLDYMKLQIKPHFFLNCLTNIHSMAQMHMYEEIQSMAISTSNYFRYIFQNGEDFVKLDDEIDHIRIYLEIQKHRYRDAFTYRIQQEAETGTMRIPPLVLQTFIENAVKYAVSRVNEVQISLEVNLETSTGEEAILIRLSDTGPGFDENILERLENGLPLDQSDGTHIGIMNTLHRINYLYHSKAKVHFSNGESGGACVELYLPHPE